MRLCKKKKKKKQTQARNRLHATLTFHPFPRENGRASAAQPPTLLSISASHFHAVGDPMRCPYRPAPPRSGTAAGIRRSGSGGRSGLAASPLVVHRQIGSLTTGTVVHCRVQEARQPRCRLSKDIIFFGYSFCLPAVTLQFALAASEHGRWFMR